MKLSNLDKDKTAVIKKIVCSDSLKKRFYSFGIIRGAEVFVENLSLAKNTIEINIENTSIALRFDEANTIEVEEV